MDGSAELMPNGLLSEPSNWDVVSGPCHDSQLAQEVLTQSCPHFEIATNRPDDVLSGRSEISSQYRCERADPVMVVDDYMNFSVLKAISQPELVYHTIGKTLVEYTEQMPKKLDKVLLQVSQLKDAPIGALSDILRAFILFETDNVTTQRKQLDKTKRDLQRVAKMLKKQLFGEDAVYNAYQKDLVNSLTELQKLYSSREKSLEKQFKKLQSQIDTKLCVFRLLDCTLGRVGSSAAPWILQGVAFVGFAAYRVYSSKSEEKTRAEDNHDRSVVALVSALKDSAVSWIFNRLVVESPLKRDETLDASFWWLWWWACTTVGCLLSLFGTQVFLAWLCSGCLRWREVPDALEKQRGETEQILGFCKTMNLSLERIRANLDSLFADQLFQFEQFESQISVIQCKAVDIEKLDATQLANLLGDFGLGHVSNHFRAKGIDGYALATVTKQMAESDLGVSSVIDMARLEKLQLRAKQHLQVVPGLSKLVGSFTECLAEFERDAKAIKTALISTWQGWYKLKAPHHE
mmetsp:Transcript_112334/g.176799  ORF Transcript_112334/g.176799 Transcript_112334/m.176799 type:complete len:519 (-) Transcript_112334:540-2096(-)